MAGIDKTYVNNYKDYKDVIDYARKTKFECPNGIMSWELPIGSIVKVYGSYLENDFILTITK